MARKGNPISVRRSERTKWAVVILSEKLVQLIEKHVVFIKTTICIILIYVGILIYTYDRSFRIHQESLSRVQRWNNRDGIFCSQVHVGNDGTTLWFQAIPKEVGTAGPIDTSILSSGDQKFKTLSMDPWLITLTVFLFLLLILLIIFYFRSKKKDGERINKANEQ